MISRRHRLQLIQLLFLTFAVLGLAQSTDPFTGTWLLSRGKSDFDPPLNFFKRTLILEPAGNGYKVTTRTVSDRQQTIESTYTATLDGKEAPVDNSPLDTMSLKRPSANVLEAVGKIKNKVVETSTWSLSADG